MQGSVLVLGLGNRLLGDDAAGPLVVDMLAVDYRGCSIGDRVVLQDGGTIGLGLLPAIEDAGGLIAVDAARLGAAPGTVSVHEGAAMDRKLAGRKSTAHEVALADLIVAAALQGRLPQRRALVAVEPQSIAVAAHPSEAVAAALPLMCEAVRQVVQRWTT